MSATRVMDHQVSISKVGGLRVGDACELPLCGAGCRAVRHPAHGPRGVPVQSSRPSEGPAPKLGAAGLRGGQGNDNQGGVDAPSGGLPSSPQGWLPSPGPSTAKPICKHEWPCPASSSSPVSSDRQAHSPISQMGKLRFGGQVLGPPSPLQVPRMPG